MSDSKNWLNLLQIRDCADADLLERLNSQIALLARSKHPRSSDFENEQVPESFAERLTVLRSQDGGAFDPTLPLKAMHILGHALNAASIDIASQLVVDTVLAQKSEEELHRQWASWFDNGDAWLCLVKRNWFEIGVRAAQRIEEWAKAEGLDRVDGAEAAMSELAARVRKLLPEEVIPNGLLGDTDDDENVVIDNDW